MDDRQRVSSGSPYESHFGFSRAVRVGNQVFVAGTAPIEPDGSVTPGGMAAQTRRCLTIIAEALTKAGASLDDVVRTRMYVADVARWEEIAAAHADAFGQVQPAATIVEVKALVDPAMLIEIEVDAAIAAGS